MGKLWHASLPQTNIYVPAQQIPCHQNIAQNERSGADCPKNLSNLTRRLFGHRGGNEVNRRSKGEKGTHNRCSVLQSESQQDMRLRFVEPTVKSGSPHGESCYFFRSCTSCVTVDFASPKTIIVFLS